MNRKKWISVLLITSILALGLLFAFNYVVDPFGVFGDKLFNWHSYNMNNNPRVSKIAYLDENHEKYDSYIISGSKGSSISPVLMNKYNEGNSYYNMMMYGGDFYDYEKTIHYLVENYKVKNIVLHMSMHEMGHFNEASKVINTELSYKVNDKPLYKYYLKYLALNLKHGFDKIEGVIAKSRGSHEYDTFIPETGTYNKKIRDSEDLGTLDDYLKKYPKFNDALEPIEGTAIDENVESLKRVVNYLDEKNVNFTFIAAPTYYKEMDRYNKDDISKLWTKIADVTDFWDFTGYNTASFDARNFYDNMHYRNSLGQWIVHKMNGKDELVPKDFGTYTTKDNIEDHLKSMYGVDVTGKIGEIKVPIVMYHNLLKKDDADSNTPSIDKFESDLKAYKAEGYETIFYKDLIDYTQGVGTLPEKPLILTFDDGYQSNYEYAYPLLKKHDMKATISIIGWSVGETKFKDMDRDIIPHFDYSQAREMINSGNIDIQSHSYDFHQIELDGEGHREGALQKKDESLRDYMDSFKEDSKKLKDLVNTNLDHEVSVYTYPYGFYNEVTDKILRDLDYKVTVTTDDGINYINKSPDSLYKLKRVNRDYNLSSEDMINSINRK